MGVRDKVRREGERERGRRVEFELELRPSREKVVGWRMLEPRGRRLEV